MRIGIDLGGTKIEGVVLGPGGDILLRRRVATPTDGYRAILDAIAEVVLGLEADLGASCQVGVGTPGAESRQTGRMKNCNTTCLNDMPLRQDLSVRLGRAVRIANDANCMALSEATDGAGAGYDSVFGVILGTGVGGGLVVQRRLLVGANGIAGEWGHNSLPANPLPGRAMQSAARQCYCGRQDCVETHLSGPALLRSFREAGGDADSAAAVAHLAAEGSELAIWQLDRYCQQLAQALAMVINIVDPEAIVLAGGLSNIAALYEKVPAYWQRWVFSDACTTPLLQAKHGDSSGVRGAAWLW